MILISVSAARRRTRTLRRATHAEHRIGPQPRLVRCGALLVGEDSACLNQLPIRDSAKQIVASEEIRGDQERDPWMFSNSGPAVKTLQTHPCRVHSALRGRGTPPA